MQLRIWMMDFVELIPCLETKCRITSSHKPLIGIGIKVLDKLLKHCWSHTVVVRGPSKILAICLTKPSVQCPWEFKVMLVIYDTYAIILFCILLHNFQRVVLRTVIDKNQFPVDKCL